MTVNNYFQTGKDIGNVNEQNLHESIIIESIQMCGQDLYYIPRTLVNEDRLLNEDPTSAFEKHYIIEMYLENFDNLEGQGSFASKLGLEMDDQCRLIISQKRFFEETGNKRPSEGDLIYFPLITRLFKIDYIELESPFFQLSKNYVFTLNCSSFSYSYEDFDTGIDEVDSTLDSAIFEDISERNEDIQEIAEDYLNFDEDNPFK